MSSSEVGLLIAILILLLSINAFFSLIETAITECHHGLLEKKQDDGDKDAKAVLALLETPESPPSPLFQRSFYPWHKSVLLLPVF